MLWSGLLHSKQQRVAAFTTEGGEFCPRIHAKPGPARARFSGDASPRSQASVQKSSPRIDTDETRIRSGEQVIEFVVGADPEPPDCVASSLTRRTYVIVHAHRPHIPAAGQLFETQGRMTRIGSKLREGTRGSAFVSCAELRVKAPEIGVRLRDQRRSKSIVSVGSFSMDFR